MGKLDLVKRQEDENLISELYLSGMDPETIKRETGCSGYLIRKTIVDFKLKTFKQNNTDEKKNQLLNIIKSDMLETLACRDYSHEKTSDLTSSFERLARAEAHAYINKEAETLQKFWDLMDASRREGNTYKVLDVEYSESIKESPEELTSASCFGVLD